MLKIAIFLNHHIAKQREKRKIMNHFHKIFFLNFIKRERERENDERHDDYKTEERTENFFMNIANKNE